MASFFLDHNVNPRLGHILRVHGHGSITAQEAHLEVAADREILLYATRLRLILVTADRDFVQLHQVGVADHAGILLIPPIPAAPRGRAPEVAASIENLAALDRPLAGEPYAWSGTLGWVRQA